MKDKLNEWTLMHIRLTLSEVALLARLTIEMSQVLKPVLFLQIM